MEIIVGALLVAICGLGGWMWVQDVELRRQRAASSAVIAEINVAFTDVMRRLLALESLARAPGRRTTNVLPFVPKPPKGPPEGQT